jgi:hypothetical protein
MAIFTFSCYSRCGSYFTSYLKKVIVRAETLDQARKYLEKWQEEQGYSFKTENVQVEQNNQDTGVIDYDFSSDY